jgi:hypothetical protein
VRQDHGGRTQQPPRWPLLKGPVGTPSFSKQRNASRPRLLAHVAVRAPDRVRHLRRAARHALQPHAVHHLVRPLPRVGAVLVVVVGVVPVLLGLVRGRWGRRASRGRGPRSRSRGTRRGRRTPTPPRPCSGARPSPRAPPSPGRAPASCPVRSQRAP